MQGKRTLSADRRRRKLITAAWSIGLMAVVIALIVLEQTAVLYILATLGVSALLGIVAFSDLAHEDKTPGDAAANTDAASVASPRSGAR